MLCGLYFLSFAIWTHDDIRAFESDQVLGSTRQTQVLGSSCDHPRQPSAEKTARNLAFTIQICLQEKGFLFTGINNKEQKPILTIAL